MISVLMEERVRIAYDLHDGTIQTLYAHGLQLDAAVQLASVPEVNEVLVEGVKRVNQLITDIRRYIATLEADSPASEPELSRDLPFVVTQTVPEGIDTVVNIAAAALQELSARDVADVLYLAREAISNAVRHARPTKIAIDLRQTPAETALTIQDNGVGFDTANTRQGFGSVTMRTRAERLGAELTVIGIPGMGTTVRIAISRRQSNDN